jgi:hypothetical protein
MDGGFVQPFKTTRDNAALKSLIQVELIIFKVLLLLVAGIFFVTWQFRDLRRAKEVTRQKREADQHQAMQRCANSDDSPSVAARQSDSK